MSQESNLIDYYKRNFEEQRDRAQAAERRLGEMQDALQKVLALAFGVPDETMYTITQQIVALADPT